MLLQTLKIRDAAFFRNFEATLHMYAGMSHKNNIYIDIVV